MEAEIDQAKPQRHGDHTGDPDGSSDLAYGRSGDGFFHFLLDLGVDFGDHDALDGVVLENLFIGGNFAGLQLFLHFGNENVFAPINVVLCDLLVDFLTGRAGNGVFGHFGDDLSDRLGLIQNTEIKTAELHGHQQPQGHQQPCAVDQLLADLAPEYQPQNHHGKDQYRGCDKDFFHLASSSASLRIA